MKNCFGPLQGEIYNHSKYTMLSRNKLFILEGCRMRSNGPNQVRLKAYNLRDVFNIFFLIAKIKMAVSPLGTP